MDPIDSSDGPVSGATFTLQPRFYVLRRGAPTGLYLSPVVTVAYLTATSTNALGDTGSLSGVGYSVGGVVGWSWIIGRHLNIKLGGGAQYLHMTVSATDDFGDAVSVGVAGVALLGELTLGWAF